ncbi:hypothetical protein BOTBODRAFT_35437 [Botryobasidium botryosum FD-172 SS1]|uniref:Tetratricopeptide repeat protein 39B n=1 Tax=Botryobasidium botryosum (strain FD-172 SS1) TaxID=930990 RepID=A0A067M750_BOTB1|nr:hypothetical protein BOTBODRAFT_35437 [Botryobasidium botryosum FD-172 SS1]
MSFFSFATARDGASTPASVVHSDRSNTADTMSTLSSLASSSVPPSPARSSSRSSDTTNGNSREVQAAMLGDMHTVTEILLTFLSSQMIEAEAKCRDANPTGDKMYYTLGNSTLQAMKAYLTFQDEDILSALEMLRKATNQANQLRRPASSLTARLAGLVIGSTSTGVGFFKGMTLEQKHAELVYAECLVQKAFLSIMYSGDWLAVVKEALNLRSAMSIFKSLLQYLEAADAEAVEAGAIEDESIDRHFRSGVQYGMGVSSLMLSLLPGKIITFAQMLGYKGDRHHSLKLLYAAGGWTKGSALPAISLDEGGLRRPLIDLTLIMFHLFVSNMSADGVDLHVAENMIMFYLERFPKGVFYLFAHGRLLVCQGRPDLAIESYRKAVEIQQEGYANLRHLVFWEQCLCHLALSDVPATLEIWKELRSSSNWSKATYTVSLAACLAQMGGEANLAEATKLMTQVPGLQQRIAGKSIPVEKFATRKAEKFKKQNGRLLLPGLELAYVFQGIMHAPLGTILTKMLPMVEDALKELGKHSSNPSKYGGGRGYWDDFCLANFLEGVCLRYVAHPDPDSILDPDVVYTISKPDAEKKAFKALRRVIEEGPKIEVDHYLVYHAHFELGRLYACIGEEAKAREHIELVLSGKHLETGPSKRKGKYSFENALLLRAHAAIELMDKAKDAST